MYRISGLILIWIPKRLHFLPEKAVKEDPAEPDIRTTPNLVYGCCSGRFVLPENTVQEDPVIVRQNRISGTTLIWSTDSEAAGTAGLGTE